MDKIAEYRRRAAEARALASRTRYLDLEESLERLATTWELLALEAERLAAQRKGGLSLAPAAPDEIQSESPEDGDLLAVNRSRK